MKCIIHSATPTVALRQPLAFKPYWAYDMSIGCDKEAIMQKRIVFTGSDYYTRKKHEEYWKLGYRLLKHTRHPDGKHTYLMELGDN